MVSIGCSGPGAPCGGGGGGARGPEGGQTRGAIFRDAGLGALEASYGRGSGPNRLRGHRRFE